MLTSVKISHLSNFVCAWKISAAYFSKVTQLLEDNSDILVQWAND